MTEAPPPHRMIPFDSDLVEYVYISVPSPASLRPVASALAALAEGASIRILDLIVIVRQNDGRLEILEIDAIDELRPLRGHLGTLERLLSDGDIELLSLAVKPATSGVVVVTEGSWAEPLAQAARQAGGHIVAGERISRSRIEATRAELTKDYSAEP